MHFEEGHLFHIYNRGNISQKIFHNHDNYYFFLKKIRQYILPYSDILAWCLMPNHFHLMIHVNHVEIFSTESLTSSETLSKTAKPRTFNDSIGIMLRTYTRAIQKQQNTNGSLFQEHTNAVCLTQNNGISPSWFQNEYGTIINISDSEREYPKVCFDYIHENPVAAGLCSLSEEWEFSSARDYFGNRNGTLINKEKAREFGLI